MVWPFNNRHLSQPPPSVAPSEAREGRSPDRAEARKETGARFEVQQVTSSSLATLLEERRLAVIETDEETGVILAVQAPDSYFDPVQLATQPLNVNPTLNELGRTTTLYANFGRDEYNPEFRGRMGLEKYDKMRRQDSATRSAMRILKTPINGATWFVEPGGEKAKDRKAAKFIELNLSSWMTYVWPVVLREALNMLDYGFYPFEKVYAFREWKGKRVLYLKKLAPRHPLDLIDDGWEYDSHGGPEGGHFYNFPGGPGHVFIPMDKLAVFTFDLEGGDLRGLSILRSAYKHWFFKEQAYKIDGIQKERHGIGIPIIKLPPGFSENDKQLAHEIGRNLRSNEKAHVVLPPNWEILFAKLEGQPVSALATADHHAKMIFLNVLAQAIYDSGGEGGTQSAMDLFYKSTREIATIISGVINQYVIPDLVGANWDVDEFPKLKVRRLGDMKEARELSFAIRNLVGAEVMQVDDRLEDWAREAMDAPMHDPSTKRELKALMNKGGGNNPNQSAQPDLPRQAPAGNTKKTPVSTKTGVDGGGTGGGTSSGS